MPTPEPPDAITLPRPPAKDAVDKWLTAWKPTLFRYRHAWRIGVIRGWIRLTDGSWVAQIEHAAGGMHESWPHMVYAVYDPATIRPIGPEVIRVLAVSVFN